MFQCVSDYHPHQFLMQQDNESIPIIQEKQINKIKKKYAKITSDQRRELVHLVQDQKQTISFASKKVGVNLSTGKAIIRVFKKEGRINKLKTRKNQKKLEDPKFKTQQEVEQIKKQLPKLDKLHPNYVQYQLHFIQQALENQKNKQNEQEFNIWN